MAPEFRSNADFKATDSMQTKQFRNTGNIKSYGNGQSVQVAQYFSDEDDEEQQPKPLAN
jgi:hypothetical protein